jgi:hypothetical protein
MRYYCKCAAVKWADSCWTFVTHCEDGANSELGQGASGAGLLVCHRVLWNHSEVG